MKRKYIYFLLATLLAFAISEADAQIGQYRHDVDSLLFEKRKCGLNYIAKVARVSAREANQGAVNSLPITFNISELPGSTCFNIEAVYVYWSLAHRMASGTTYYAEDKNFVPVCSFTRPDGVRADVRAVTLGYGEGTNYGNAYSVGFRADVTNQVYDNGNYTINVNNTSNADLDQKNWETNGVAMIIIYSDLHAGYEGHLKIYDGFYTMTAKEEEWKRLDFSQNICEKTKNGKGFALVSELQKNLKDNIYNYSFKINNSVTTFEKKFMNFDAANFDVAAGWNDIKIDITGMSKNPPPSEDDHSTAMLVGYYYQTENCAYCRPLFPLVVEASDNPICEDDSTVLTPNFTLINPPKELNYNWTSDPAGFTSNIPSPKVGPKVTTTYHLHVDQGVSCISADTSITVIVNPRPIIDAGKDTNVCFGKEIRIGSEAERGTPPYYYSWTPPSGLSDRYSATPIANPAVETKYFLTVVDSKGCTRTDSVNISIAKNIPPAVYAESSTNICQCDSVTLVGEKGFDRYLWSNGETTPDITVNSEGNYFLTTVDKNGCVAFSDTIPVSHKKAVTTVETADRSARPGDTLSFPLRMSQSEMLDICKYYNYKARIAFNKSLLFPKDTLLLKSTTDATKRYVEISGTRISGVDLLTEFELIAALGDSPTSPVEIESFEWSECNKTQVNRTSNLFTLSGLCENGGIRLTQNIGAIMSAKVEPSVINSRAKFSGFILEKGFARAVLYSSNGIPIKTIYESNSVQGRIDADFSTDDLAPGAYFLYLTSISGGVCAPVLVVK